MILLNVWPNVSEQDFTPPTVFSRAHSVLMVADQ